LETKKQKEESPKKAINEIIFPIYKGKDQEKKRKKEERLQIELWNNNFFHT